MYLDYFSLITDPPDELADLERKHRGRPTESRLKMLRLLKNGSYPSRRALAPVLGYSERQLKRWFDAYREGGLEALLDRGQPGGSSEKVTDEAWKALEEKMKAGEIARLEDARSYLEEEHNISYAGIQGISMLFQRRGVKLKTGRRKHRKGSPEEQAAFKK